MKQLIKIGLLSPLLFSTSLFALTPIDGFYFGLLGEMSHGPSNDGVYFHEGTQIYHGTVGYSPLSAGAGAMLGYKYQHLRGEAEFLYNRISTGPVTVSTCGIQNHDISTPTGVCPPLFVEQALGFSGNSSAVYGFFNAYWDFFSNEEKSDLDPYLGIGVGESIIKNGNSFVNTITDYAHGQTYNSSGIAYQGIVGIGYFMDSFAWCSMDYRFVSTTRKASNGTDNATLLPSKSYTLSTLNFTINAVFG